MSLRISSRQILQAERYECMEREELISLVPQLTEDDAEKILELFSEIILEKSTEYENAVAELESRYAKAELDRMIKEELQKANPKSADILKALLDEDNIAIENGALTGLSEQIESLKKNYEFLFQNSEEKPKFTKETKNPIEDLDLKKLSYKDRLKLYSEMPEVYSQLMK